jgi:hypothetical protein
LDEELVCEDASDCQEIKDGCHKRQDSRELEDYAFRSRKVPGGEPDLEAQEQQAGYYRNAYLNPTMLEQDKGQEIGQGDGNHQTQEIDIVSEINGFLGAPVTNCHSKRAEEQGRYDAAGQGKI